MIDQRELRRSLEQVNTDLRKAAGKHLSNYVIKEAMIKEAEIIRVAMADLAPQSSEIHYIRYNRNKNRKRLYPGNLKKSMTIFPAEGLDVQIGPRTRKAKFGDKKADGFYGYFVNFGLGRNTKEVQFKERAIAQTKEVFFQKLKLNILKKVGKAQRRFESST